MGLAKFLVSEPARAAGATFLGVWIPGVNRTDYSGLHPEACAELIFQSSDFRPSFEAGRSAFRPLSYGQAWRWLETASIDAAFALVSPADDQGLVCLGVSADFTPAVLARDDVRKIAIISRAMPAPRDAPRFPLASFDLVIQDDAPLLTYDCGAISSVFDEIASWVVSLVEDGATLQFGLGNLQFAVLRELRRKRDLRIHSGMITDPVADAIKAGAIAAGPSAIVAGVALGGPELYALCARDARFSFRSVAETHDIGILSKLDRFTAINSVIEVDLFGQANGEFIDGRQMSGAGGLVDFLRGAARSPGGKPIVALPSTARRGATSRIVPKLTAPATTVARADVGFVVTEHGVADLRGASIEERALALIAIADPTHRDDLKSAWRRMASEL
ncbi:MAG: acetyl-CoA hydrolase [Alphaproteobacteria bacterium]|nr:acetyl-CoA hydrolase [Alphaproteobacteria bacterium]